MNDNIKVAVRIRPLLNKNSNKIHWINDDKTIFNSEKKDVHFVFDQVFGMEATNYDVYQQVVQPIIECAVNGYNGTVFAYGQTASGKTYTMMGTEESPGIVLQAVDYIFECIENTPDRTYLLRISLLELYNEHITDLLSSSDKPLRLCEDKDNVPFVANLTEEVVRNASEMFAILAEGKKKCHVGETLMNERSSRSHTIFRIVIESQKTLGADDEIVISQLNLVDLAGSEKSGQVNTVVNRFKEGCSINLSLLALTQVISKLSDGNRFVNFRDSKLTRILKPSLGGNAKTTIICNITPTVYDETLSTLKFAERAKRVKNKPKINASLAKNSVLKQYENEIANLQQQLEQEKQSKRCEDLQKELELKNHRITQLQENLLSLQEKLIVSSHAVTYRLPTEKIANRRETWCVPATFKLRSCSSGLDFSSLSNKLLPTAFSKRSTGNDQAILNWSSQIISTDKDLFGSDTFSNINTSFESNWSPTLTDAGCVTEITLSDVDLLTKQNHSLTKENEELKRQIKEKQLMKETLHAKEINEDNHKLNLENKKLEEDILHKEKTTQEALDQLKVIANTIHQLRHEIGILNSERDNLELQVVANKSLEQESALHLQELRKELCHLQDDLKDITAENLKLKNARKENDSLTREMELKNKEIKTLTSEINELKETHEKTILKLISQNEALLKSVDEKQKELQKSIDELCEMKNAMEDVLQENCTLLYSKKENDSLKSELKMKNERLEDMTSQLQELQKEVCRLMKDVEEISAENLKLQNDEKENATLMMQLELKNKRIEDLTFQLNEFKEAHKRMELELSTQNNTLFRSVDEKQEKLQKMIEEVEKLTEINGNLLEENSNLKNCEEKIRALETELKTKAKLLEDSISQLDILKEHNEKLKMEFKSEVELLKERYESKLKDMEQNEDKKLQYMSNELSELWENERKAHSKTRQELYQTQSAKESAIKMLQLQIDNLKDDLQVAVFNKENKCDCNRLGVSHPENRRRLNDSTNLIDAKSATEEIKILQNRLQQESEQMQNKIKSLSSDVRTRDNEIQMLKSHIKRKEAPLYERIDNLEKEITFVNSRMNKMKLEMRRLQTEKQNTTVAELVSKKEDKGEVKEPSPSLHLWNDMGLAESCKLEILEIENKKLKSENNKLKRFIDKLRK